MAGNNATDGGELTFQLHMNKNPQWLLNLEYLFRNVRRWCFSKFV